VLLVLVELGLRLAGYGYPTGFLLAANERGQEVFVENPKFGWRFFPPELARSPQPLSIAAQKPQGTIRIVVLGESAAMGDPEPAYGVARQVERMLSAKHPEKKFEVINAAMTAINSHVMREIANDCTGLRADCWVIYAGNNEVVGPFGAGTVFGRQAASLGAVRFSLLLKKTRVGQLLSSGFRRSDGPAEWEGMEMFLRKQVPARDKRLDRVYQNFAANLEAVVRRGVESGARVLLVTMPVNLKDCPPFSSTHRARLAASEETQWEKDFERGRAAEGQGKFGEALKIYGELAQADPEFGEFVFRRGTCELALDQVEPARTDFLLARDLDALRFRADTRLNGIVRETAVRVGVPLVDAEEGIAKRVPAIPGDELFYDHVHLNFSGNYCLAALLVPEIEKQLWAAEKREGKAITPEREMVHGKPQTAEGEVARALAFTDFDRQRVFEEVRLRLRQPPFRSQTNYRERDERWEKLLAGLVKAPRQCLPEYDEAVKASAEDWVLHANYARVLEAAGENTGAKAEWREVARLIPHEAEAWFQLGNLAEGAGLADEAEGWFREALKRKADCTEAFNGLGLVCSGRGRKQEARSWFERALKLNKRFTAARVNLAVLLANSGDPAGAAAQYREVLRTDADNVAARVNLARILLAQHQYDKALALYREALELKPDDAIVHYNLANLLGEHQRGEEAIEHYRAAIQAKSGFAEARYNLGLELARRGQVNEALEQLAEVVRLKPDFVDAHFNYGIALAKEQRYSEAVREFRETLRLNPNHASANASLERALKLMSRN
jgi:tetratricopeptide (TPR) repeat protein